MITPTIAVNSTIKPSLIKDFGIALSTLIILQNSKKCDLMIANLDRDGYIRLVNSIISDYRVAKTLSKDDIDIRKKEWIGEIE
ncbi:MAG: hypothetical protein ACE5J3_09020 [Methanosarcinales archaeon]